jgi:AAA+ superfamily predicted ATPase
MAPDGDRPEDHDALLTAVRRGDILLFNGRYNGDGAHKIKKLYEEAAANAERKVISDE